jgi:hypothetical protein
MPGTGPAIRLCIARWRPGRRFALGYRTFHHGLGSTIRVPDCQRSSLRVRHVAKQLFCACFEWRAPRSRRRGVGGAVSLRCAAPSNAMALADGGRPKATEGRAGLCRLRPHDGSFRCFDVGVLVIRLPRRDSLQVQVVRWALGGARERCEGCERPGRKSVARSPYTAVRYPSWDGLRARGRPCTARTPRTSPSHLPTPGSLPVVDLPPALRPRIAPSCTRG